MPVNQPNTDQIAAFRQENMGRLFLRAHRAFSDRAFEKFQAHHHPGLRSTHLAIIAQLDMEGAHITTLAERAGMTKQAVSQLVDELVSRGYVQRAPDPKSRRATLVRFTEAGLGLLQDAYYVKQEIEAEYVAVLGEDGFAQLRSLLNSLLSGIA